MPIGNKRFLIVLGLVIVARLFAMAAIPLADTSEPRYAEIARLMAASDDWITPWFEPGVPFWGKPPLAFWAQALSIELFGLSEFALRLPTFAVMALVAGLVYAAALAGFGRQTARWSTLVLATMLLPLLSAGAVLTDPFLALGVALPMLALLVPPPRLNAFWRYGFFVGLAIGLLAKGPLALALVGGVCAAWALWSREARARLAALPWLGGLGLMLALSLPWYVAAELKTPGFLNYFLVGEHFMRFVDSGWAGDRYGSAHARPWGAIWLDWLAAGAPWSLLCVAAIAALAFSRRARQAATNRLREPAVKLLILWALAAPGLFTLSGNILWTYVLPSLPAAALGLGLWLARVQPAGRARLAGHALTAALLLIPAAAVTLGVLGIYDEQRFKSEKGLIAAAGRILAPGETLYFVGSEPFSARFYSRGATRLLSWQGAAIAAPGPARRMLVAVPRGKSWPLLQQPGISAQARYSSRRFTLYELTGAAARQPASGAD